MAHPAYVPVGTPADRVAVLRDALVKSIKTKAVVDFYKTFAGEPLELAGEAFAAFQRADFERWGNAAREAGLKGTL